MEKVKGERGKTFSFYVDVTTKTLKKFDCSNLINVRTKATREHLAQILLNTALQAVVSLVP